MSYVNSSLNKANFYNENNTFIDDKKFFYEKSNNISFNILSNYNNINNEENNFSEEILNKNKNAKNILDSFLTKLYNNDSILIIDDNNIKDIFSIFKQIIFSYSKEFSTSIVININNFEVIPNKEKEKIKLNKTSKIEADIFINSLLTYYL